MSNYTRTQLNNDFTARELKDMCVYELHIPGMTKKRKGVVIDAILAHQRRMASRTAEDSETSAAPKTAENLSAVSFQAQSVMTNPKAAYGSRISTTVQVSCGAASGAFPVVGRKVEEVADFLKEVLNIEGSPKCLVNGSSVDSEYIIKTGDFLEFVKPARKKG